MCEIQKFEKVSLFKKTSTSVSLVIERSEYKEHSFNTVFFEQRVMNIKFFGLPFTVEKTTHYQCTYGRKYYKSKAKDKVSFS